MEISPLAWLNLEIPLLVSITHCRGVNTFSEPELIWAPRFTEERGDVSLFDSSRNMLHHSRTIDTADTSDFSFEWTERPE